MNRMEKGRGWNRMSGRTLVELGKAVGEVVEAGKVDTMGSGEWWSLVVEWCWKQWRRTGGGVWASERS